MDADALPSIALLLAPSSAPSVRETALAALAACTAGSTSSAVTLRQLLGTTESGEAILSRTVRLIAQPRCEVIALTTLVNTSEEQSASLRMIKHNNLIPRAANALLNSELEEYWPLYAALLSNLTRFPQGVDALVAKDADDSRLRDVAVNRLHKLVLRVGNIPNVLWLPNACTTEEGRDALLLAHNQPVIDHDKQPLSHLLKLLSHEDATKRLAAASALRNCALAEDCHDILVTRTNAIGTCLCALISPSCTLKPAQLPNAPVQVKHVVANPKTATPERHVEIRLLLVEALLLLCKSRIGRETLRDQNAYEVLEEWLKSEEHKPIDDAIASILDRIVVAEDDEVVDITSVTNKLSIAQS